jgi:hypothetical protein
MKHSKHTTLDFDPELKELNNPSAWDGLPLTEQTLEQLAGNLAYNRQQLADYRANYGGDHSGANDSFQEGRLKARIVDIEAEMSRRP